MITDNPILPRPAPSQLDPLAGLREEMSVPCGYEECQREKLCGACEFGLKAIDRAFKAGEVSGAKKVVEKVEEAYGPFPCPGGKKCPPEDSWNTEHFHHELDAEPLLNAARRVVVELEGKGIV